MENQGFIQNLPECSCANDITPKYRHYYHDDQLLGVCCTKCGLEWLQERFLFHPDEDNPRPSVNVNDVVLKKQLAIPIERNPAFQVSSRRTMSRNFKFEGDDLKVGDHITWHRPLGLWHHAIVSEVVDEAGKVKVIQWEKTAFCVKERKESLIDLNTEKGQLFRIDYSGEVTDINPPELVIARARAMFDDPGKYNVLGDNCEAYASYCKNGVYTESCQRVWLNWSLTTLQSLLTVSFNTSVGQGHKKIIIKEIAIPMVIRGNRLLKKCQTKPKGKLIQLATTSIHVGKKIRIECENECKEIRRIDVGIIIFIDGVWCVYDLSHIYEKRANGDISRVDFLQTSIHRVVDVLASAGFCTVGGYLGAKAAVATSSLGKGSLILGGIIGGIVCTLGAKGGGYVVGPWIGRALASIIGTDDRAVEIGDLEPGNQIVFYCFLLHPRHHAIVVSCDPDTGKVRVVHHTYQRGVVEEELDFISPVYRLLYDNECYLPDEVIERARSKIGDETYMYSLAFNNCKTFARWCKVK